MVSIFKEVKMTFVNQADFFKQLDFMTAQRNKRFSDADVSVMVVEGAKTESKTYGKRLSLTFRNHCLDKLGEGDRIKIARFKNRLIIIKADDGMKVSQMASTYKSQFCRFNLSEDDISTYLAFEGDYKLKFDDLYEYYYIEKDASAANENAPSGK